MKPFWKIVTNYKKWLPVKCNSCGWLGSGEKCGNDWAWSDDSDCYCPRCGSSDTDTYEHNFYPIWHPVTDLISRIKGWRMRRAEEKYCGNEAEQNAPDNKLTAAYEKVIERISKGLTP